MFNRILVAIDKSELINKILDVTMEIAHNKRTHVTLIHVSNLNVAMGLPYIPEDYLEEILIEMDKDSIKYLEEAKSQLISKGISTEIIHLKGDPAHEILKYAKNNQQQLTVIGSRGLSGMKEMMLGSVSHKVSQLSSCPVLIVHLKN
ncbi:universal stress protein [Paenibacillus lentus]|uniref:universal stress protein n=1 Tax=Paenibacillus lentus TaxID=1338368 RepID=UPI0036564C05